MYKIGNIIYDCNLINHDHVDYINYINKPFSFKNLDTNLPTLYVGRNFLKESNLNDKLIQKQSILEKKIINNLLYWEFSFEENKSEHISGIEMFVLNLPHYYFFSNFTYTNIDPVFFNISNINELIELIPVKINYCYNYKNEMLYLLSKNNITGIDINMYNFFDFKTDIIVNHINERTIKNIDDFNGKIFNDFNKKFSNFDFLKRYLVVLLSDS